MARTFEEWIICILWFLSRILWVSHHSLIIDQFAFAADISNKWHFQNFHRSTWRFLSQKASSLLGTLGSTTWPGRSVWPLGKPNPPPSFCPSTSWAWATSLVHRAENIFLVLERVLQVFLLIPLSGQSSYFLLPQLLHSTCCQLGFSASFIVGANSLPVMHRMCKQTSGHFLVLRFPVVIFAHARLGLLHFPGEIRGII